MSILPMRESCHPGTTKRRGAAAVELAVLLPFLVLLFVIAVDFSRIYYHSQVLENCARNGALFGSKLVSDKSPYSNIEEAALADAVNLSPEPSVQSVYTVDATGNPCVRVTVNWQFKMVSGFPGLAGTYDLSRTVQMRVPQF